MDASITPLRHGGLSLVQTTDFFYPLVEDPYMQGEFLGLLDVCYLTLCGAMFRRPSGCDVLSNILITIDIVKIIIIASSL